MKSVEFPNTQVPLVEADGRLTVPGMVLLQKMAEALVEAQARIEALESA